MDARGRSEKFDPPKTSKGVYEKGGIAGLKAMDKKGLGELLDPPRTRNGDYEKGGAIELARRTGISDKTIRSYLKLLDLEPEITISILYGVLRFL